MGITCEGRVVHLAGSVEIDQVDELKTLFMALLGEAGEAVTVDLSQVEEIDFSIMQLLFAAHKSLARQGRGLALRAPSASFLKRQEQLGGVPPIPSSPSS